jgi:hypothetical protein
MKECCVLGFWSRDNFRQNNGRTTENHRKANRRICERPKNCFSSTPQAFETEILLYPNQSSPHTDRHLEDILVNNIGTRELLTKHGAQILRYILDGKTNKQLFSKITLKTVCFEKTMKKSLCRFGIGPELLQQLISFPLNPS